MALLKQTKDRNDVDIVCKAVPQRFLVRYISRFKLIRRIHDALKRSDANIKLTCHISLALKKMVQAVIKEKDNKLVLQSIIPLKWKILLK